MSGGRYEHKTTARELEPWNRVPQPVPPTDDPEWQIVSTVVVNGVIHDTWERYKWPPIRPEQPGAPIPKKFREASE